jgi:hypothetical protein
MALLNLLKKEGDLVDIYSQEFFDRQPLYEEDPYAPFNREVMVDIDGYEADPEENIKPKNHLLFIFVDPYKNKLNKKLAEIYPLLVKYFEFDHKPDFLILNLYTQQMLVIGLGRKNQIYAYDSVSGAAIDLFGGPNYDGYDKYMDRFTEHDLCDAVGDLTKSLLDLGEAMFDYDQVPHNGDMFHIAYAEGPKPDGLFYVEDYEEGYSQEEVEDFLERFTDSQARGEKALKVIQAFFPQCEWGELNTGDN